MSSVAWSGTASTSVKRSRRRSTARVSFPFTRGEAWTGGRHRLTTSDGRIIEFIVEGKRPYPPDPRGDEVIVEGRLTADYHA